MPEPNQAILLAEMDAEFVIDGRLVSAPARVLERLLPYPQVVIEVSNVPREPEPMSPSASDQQSPTVVTFPITSEGPSTVQLDNGMRVKVVASSWVLNQTEMILHLQESPCVVLNSGNPISRLHFSLLNFTGDVFDWPISLQAPPWLVNIAPVPNLTEIDRALRKSRGYSVTHQGTIERRDGQGFSAKDAEVFLDGLGAYLSFLCGSSCDVTNVIGTGTGDDTVWQRWGTHHVSPWQRRRSWSDVTIRTALAVTFAAFWNEYQKRKDQWDRVLGWYVYSNESGAVDVSIIFNQVALELLLNLTGAGIGMGKQPMGERISDMLEAKGIPSEIPALCEKLNKMKKEHGYQHGPHALVNIRNSLVHKEDRLGINSIDVYYEAAQLGLWYVELLILRMFEYTGEYASRLADVQRAGATEPVPWANGAQPQL